MKHVDICLAIKAALNAGEEILTIYNDPSMDFQVEKKADNSPLTIADKKAHEAIVAILKETQYPILSEEGSAIDYQIRKSWDALWVVDPLDGTKEFIKRNGEFTVNIALVHKGVPTLGVIYLPTKQTLYFAEASLGAYKCDGIDADNYNEDFEQLVQQSLRMPYQNIKDKYVVVASRSHLTPETKEFIDELMLEHSNVEMISSGSSIKICLVAEGSADVYPRFAPTMEWDTAAGDAIARAAGMKVCQADQITPLVYNKENLLNPWFIIEKVK